MLARFSRRSSRWLEVRVESGFSSPENDDIISLDVDVLASLILPSDLSWRRVAGMCGRTVSPMYTGLQSMVQQDVDHVARLLYELDPLSETDETLSPRIAKQPLSPKKITAESSESLPSDPCQSEEPRRKRRRSSALTDPLIIRSSHPSAPTIIITPCSPQARETSCWVPYQDASFGACLTIPSHPALNDIHPPLARPTGTLPHIENWEYAEGHWKAILPTLSDQCSRGLYSKPIVTRRRACRTRFPSASSS
ncbi:hypothetical protein BJ138DRAFT_1054227 [Hygrophoropsis aurantiaca]|uniref:Uncharacterized protein n=1 Tax=Hygrophoropsis aurantiaca TaxID=72124 RepID=A0ACB8AR12_9AGAM|nr:hypothetical protein BJ138DRAFT_1054227 [Hygrophoropsis aurantiaca]